MADIANNQNNSGPIIYSMTPNLPAHHATSDQYNRLLRKISIVFKNRFEASARLAFHHKVSQWTIAMTSVALVIASLLSMESGAVKALPHAGEIEIIIAVFVLVLSLLIGMDNYPLRADKMHICALELNDLHRRFSVMDELSYIELAKEYNEILSKFENHGKVDNYFTQLREAVADLLLEEPHLPGNTKLHRNKLRAMITFRYGLSLLPYLAASLVVLISLLYFGRKLQII